MKNVNIERYLHRRKSLRYQYFTPATPFHPRKMAAEVSQRRGIDGTRTKQHNSIRVYTYIKFIEATKVTRLGTSWHYHQQNKKNVTTFNFDPPQNPTHLIFKRIHLPNFGGVSWWLVERQEGIDDRWMDGSRKHDQFQDFSERSIHQKVNRLYT